MDLGGSFAINNNFSPQTSARSRDDNEKEAPRRVPGGETSTHESVERRSNSDTSPSQTLKNILRKSLLHLSCRCKPKDFHAIEGALRIDANGINRRLNPNHLEVLLHKMTSEKKMASIRGVPIDSTTNLLHRPTIYGFPINIALQQGSILPVIKMLCAAGPRVLNQTDGPRSEASLHVAVKSTTTCSIDTIMALLEACPDAACMVDRHDNTPLHAACLHRPKNAELLLELIKVYPSAVKRRNFHGYTPLQVLQRSGAEATNEVLTVLQGASASNTRR